MVWVSHTCHHGEISFYITMTECWLCEEHAVAEDGVVYWPYSTADSVLCEVKAEAEETIEHLAYDTL
jgi:hypothetical protein